MRSFSVMPILLYALGVCLFLWSAVMLLRGDAFAAIDIAANLAGWGAFTIGLGALTGALHRLTRTVARRGGTLETPPSAAYPKSRDDRRQADIVPMFVPGGERPAHFEPTPEPRAERPAPPPEPARERALDLERELESALAPSEEPDDARDRLPPLLAAAPSGGEADDGPADDRKLSKKERRARKRAKQEAEGLDAPQFAAPAIGAGGAILSGPSAGAEPEPSEPAGEMFERARPIASSRPKQERDAVHDVPETNGPAAEELPPPEPEPRLDASAEEPDPATAPPQPEETAAETVTAEPVFAAEPARAPLEEQPRVVPAPDAPEPTPPVHPAARAEAPSAPEPKVPEWLARARARREARARAEREGERPEAFAAAPAPAEPQQPTEEIAMEPVFGAERPAAEPDAAWDETPSPEDRQTSSTEDDLAPASSDTPPEDPQTSSTEDDLAPASSEAAPDPDSGEGEDEDAPRLVSEGEHNGVLYRFFEDGSVEAVSAYGVRRFTSIDELRETVRSARGYDDEAEASSDDQGENAAAPRQPDPLDAALAELEGEAKSAPELRIEPADRLDPDRRG